MGRANALKKNILAGWLGEAVTLISGLILPRLILVAFGSSCNGLLSSIVQFLNFSTLLRAGVGAVTRAALFKPLADGNKNEIDKIMATTQSYMNKISFLVGLYIAILAIVYPFVAKGEYNWWYIFTLTFIIGSTTFVDNLVGVKYKVLFQADQKYYVEIICVAVSKIASLIISVVLIKLGYGIHIVKIGAALATLLNPLVITIYSKKTYNIDFSVEGDNSVISQRWDAFAQQMAIIVNSNVGLTILSLFAKLTEISVYTVHYMVSHMMESVFVATTVGVTSTFGNIIAKNEDENLKKVFLFIEWGFFAAFAVVFSITAVMITPFISIYTDGVSDVNYIRPIFAIMMTAAAFGSCMRRPYQSLVEAAGHFKQTRNSAVAEVIINVVVSIIMLKFFGIIGVAIGSFAGSLFRSLHLALYSMKNIIKLPKRHLVKTYIVYFATFLIIILVCNKMVVARPDNYFSWACYAILVSVVAVVIVAVVSLVFNRHELIYLKNKLLSKSGK
ncbi:MAG: hypothetical protein E7394_02565 [Ruminococcaceae bacterium]|nr:hypothetical protein [Oscillospiraceae bacterium]